MDRKGGKEPRLTRRKLIPLSLTPPPPQTSVVYGLNRSFGELGDAEVGIIKAVGGWGDRREVGSGEGSAKGTAEANAAARLVRGEDADPEGLPLWPLWRFMKKEETENVEAKGGWATGRGAWFNAFLVYMCVSIPLCASMCASVLVC